MSHGAPADRPEEGPSPEGREERPSVQPPAGSSGSDSPTASARSVGGPSTSRGGDRSARQAVILGAVVLLAIVTAAAFFAMRTLRGPWRPPNAVITEQEFAEPVPEADPSPAGIEGEIDEAGIESGAESGLGSSSGSELGVDVGTPPELGRDPGMPGMEDARARTVLVRVVEAATGAPVEGCEVELGSEEPARRVIAVQRTGRDGTTRFEDVRAPLVLALVRRGERFAAAVVVAREASDGARSAVVRLSAGGTVVGRVVDASGTPIAGAELSLVDVTPWPMPVLVPRAAATSGADGGFAIPRVVDLPRMVSRRDGRIFASSWAPVQVQARTAGGVSYGAVSIPACGEARLPDLVVPTPARISGRVVDGQSRALAGALVSAHPARALAFQYNLHVVAPELIEQGVADPPGSPRFRLLPGETLTAEDGSFELHATPQRGALIVAPPGLSGGVLGGAMGDLALPGNKAPAPGAIVEGLELAFPAGEVLRVRLFDTDGRPVLGVAPRPELGPCGESPPGRPPPRFAPISGPPAGAWTQSRIELLAETSDGASLRVEAAPGGDGTVAFLVPERLAALERVTIVAPGFRPAVIEARGRLRVQGPPTELCLERLATIALSLALADADDDDRRASDGAATRQDPYDVYVKACALPPQSVTTGSAPRPMCCGSGVGAWFALSCAEVDLDLPVLEEREFWISLRVSRGRRGEELLAGPFRPGRERERLELSSLPPNDSPWERAMPPDARTDPRARVDLVDGTLCVFDEKSGRPLAGAEIWPVCDPTGRERLLGRAWRAGEDGCATLDGLCAGDWSFAVAAAGHRTRLLGPLAVAATTPRDGEARAEVDLGEARLAPVD